jgi:hypothetical protein
MILPLSAYQVARNIAKSHQCLAQNNILKILYSSHGLLAHAYNLATWKAEIRRIKDPG